MSISVFAFQHKPSLLERLDDSPACNQNYKQTPNRVNTILAYKFFIFKYRIYLRKTEKIKKGSRMVTAVMVKLSHGIMNPWERPMVGVRVAMFSLQSMASPGVERCLISQSHGNNPFKFKPSINQASDFECAWCQWFEKPDVRGEWPDDLKLIVKQKCTIWTKLLGHISSGPAWTWT